MRQCRRIVVNRQPRAESLAIVSALQRISNQPKPATPVNMCIKDPKLPTLQRLHQVVIVGYRRPSSEALTRAISEA